MTVGEYNLIKAIFVFSIYIALFAMCTIFAVAAYESGISYNNAFIAIFYPAIVIIFLFGLRSEFLIPLTRSSKMEWAFCRVSGRHVEFATESEPMILPPDVTMRLARYRPKGKLYYVDRLVIESCGNEISSISLFYLRDDKNAFINRLKSLAESIN